MSSQCCQEQKRSDSRVSDSETYLSDEISARFEIGDIRHDSSSDKIWTTIDYNVVIAKSTIDKGKTDFRMSACPPVTGQGCSYRAPCKGMSQSHTEIEMESTTVAIRR
ncbi:hypothetical protein ALC53_04979 [Atta colombica]|uniref:Uncharacterized protein n=1 Tax=Atta colombica TaxID=520822 RepID=A0A195BKQ9_9HYME|nr:hypothetical protein ALC53_04979 [Atta colombica]